MATIEGTSGNDSLAGSAGDDSITGGEGGDTITAGAGHDFVDGGSGDDSIFSGDGANTVTAGDGDDTIEGGTGNEALSGDAGADSIHGWAGDDTIDGGADDDTLYGDDGDDSIEGGAGDDLIYAGAGNDTIGAGPGTDTVYGNSGADTFIVTAGGGQTTIEDYNAAEGDLIAIGYPGITSFAELQPYLQDDGNWGTLIALPDGTSTHVKWLNHGTVSAANFTFDAAPVCLMRGTLVATATGPLRVEKLRPGALIRTRDHGFQPLLHVSRSSFRFAPGPHRMKPIRVKPGALGPGRPASALLVSPKHRIALPQDAPRRLVAARQLAGWPGISERPSCRKARYFRLLLARHELIEANGAWVESLLVTDYTIRLARLPASLHRFARELARPLARGPAAPAGTA